MAAPQWPKWLETEGFNANYLSVAPNAEKLQQQLDAGMNVVFLKLWLLRTKQPEDPTAVRVSMGGDHSLASAARWARLCREQGAHFTVMLNMIGAEERAWINAAPHRAAVSMDGRENDMPCPQDETWWSLIEYQAVAVARAVPDCEGAVLDTESYRGSALTYPYYGRWPLNMCYCDVCFGEFARQNGLDPDLPKDRRYALLRDRGLIDAYQAHLRGEMREVGEGLMAAVHAINPRFFVGLVNYDDNWWMEGLAQGLGSEDCPTVLMTENEYYEPLATDFNERMQRLTDLGVRAAYCPGFAIYRWPPRQMAVEALQRMLDADGYWIFCGNNLYDDDYADREGVWRLFGDASPSQYYALLAQAQDAWAAASDAAAEAPVGMDALARIDEARSSPYTRDGDSVVLRRTREAPNLLADPSFEGPWPEQQGPWSMYYRPKPDADMVFDGDRSVRIDANYKRANLKQTIALEPGREYLFGVWTRLEDVIGERGAVTMVNERMHWMAGTHDWEPVSMPVTVDEETPETRFLIALQAHCGTAWYDAACVREVEELELWTEPISLGSADSRPLLSVAAEVGPFATLAVETYAEDDLWTPLLPAVPVEASLRRDLSSVALMLPEGGRVRLRIVARFGSGEGERVEVRKLRIDERALAARRRMTAASV